MTPLLASRLFDYALNTLWQLPLLAASTWLLIRLARPSVALQHPLWIATLFLATLLPLRTPPASPIKLAPAALSPSTLPSAENQLSAAPSSTPTQASSSFELLSLLRPHPIHLSLALIARITTLWLLLLAINLLRLTLAWLASRHLVVRARISNSTLDPAFLAACATRLNIPIPEVLLLRDPHATPAVAGLFRPVLLLPAHFEHDYELTAILLHEFAHIRRRDTLVNLLCRIVALPIAWHPVTPLLHARIGQTREILCDTLAARAAGSSIAYARSLLTLARDIHSTSNPNLATLGLYRSQSHLEERIMKLITPPSSTPANRTARIATGIALVAAATCTAAAFHLQAVAAAQRPAAAAPLLPIYARTPTTDGWQLSPQPTPKPSALTAYTSTDNGATWHAITPTQPSHDQTHQDQTAPPAPPTPPTALAPLAALPAVAPIAPMPPLPALPAVAPLAPQTMPAPTPAPAPALAPIPAPHPHAHVIVNGVQRDLTPAEQANLEKQLAAAREQIHVALSQKFIDEKALAAQLKALKSPEVQRQIAEAQKQINSPEFQKQIADARKLAIDKAMNSDEIRRQMDQAVQQIKIAQANIALHPIDVHIDQAKLQEELKAASEALANVKVDVHIDTVQIQKQLEAARKQLEDARRNNQQTPPQP